MKRDANSVLREQGVVTLRDVLDKPRSTALFDPARLPSGRALSLRFFDDCEKFVRRDWIVKGVLAKGETSSWIALPGAGKSALLTEIAVHVSRAADWRGKKITSRHGVLYFALERSNLVLRRLSAYRKRDGLKQLPISVASKTIDLMNPSCVDIIVDTLMEAENKFGIQVGLIIIDTFAKGIAAGGGDEDKARDQGRVHANLARLHELMAVHIALIGHTGKNEDRGARGSNAQIGDADLMVQISGNGTKTAEVTKANDLIEGPLVQFKMAVVNIGIDEDGEPVTTSILSPEVFELKPAAGKKAKKDKLPEKPSAGLKELWECIADRPGTPPADEHVPKGAKGVTLEIWKDRLLKRAVINKNGNPRQEFKRIHVTLKKAGAIGIWDDFVWAVT